MITVSTQDLNGELTPTETRFAPPTLFLEGNPALLQQPSVAIIGSRQALDDGLRRATRLAKILADEGIVVVSGLARGIDTAAHWSALRNRGQTIAVIGTPLDRHYPAENEGLQTCIAREHLVVSQFKPGQEIRPTNFTARNRTMALLSDATVIIEAQFNSGTRYQGWEAIRLGRPVFIAQSLVDRGPRWVGEMVRSGARVLNERTISELVAVKRLAPAA